MKHIVNFSGGACSFWAGYRTLKKFGNADTIFLFADTLYEHPDLYDFNRKTEEVLGVKIVRISEELNPWQLFAREGMIGNDRFPICSTKLKREPLNSWMDSNFEMNPQQFNFCKDNAAVVLGFDYTELHRVQDFQNQHPSWQVEAPMTEEPLWDKCRMIKECEALGFTTPTLYKLGFPHNNCGGFCVKAGISHYVHLYNVLPEVFRKVESEEYQTQISLKNRGVSNWQFTILKDRRGGTTKPLPLTELRHRIESGEEFSKMDWGGCGCGGAVQKAQE